MWLQENFQYSTLSPLILGKWKREVDNSKFFGALLTDLFKAFYCICNDLLITKLYAYHLPLSIVKLVHDYFQNHKQRTKNGLAYSLWEEIIFGVPKGPIVGPVLFSTFHYVSFPNFENNYFANYTDHTTTYVIDNNPKVNLLKNYLLGLPKTK